MTETLNTSGECDSIPTLLHRRTYWCAASDGSGEPWGSEKAIVKAIIGHAKDSGYCNLGAQVSPGRVLKGE